jgi:hypothetical protein
MLKRSESWPQMQKKNSKDNLAATRRIISSHSLDNDKVSSETCTSPYVGGIFAIEVEIDKRTDVVTPCLEEDTFKAEGDEHQPNTIFRTELIHDTSNIKVKRKKSDPIPIVKNKL